MIFKENVIAGKVCQVLILSVTKSKKSWGQILFTRSPCFAQECFYPYDKYIMLCVYHNFYPCCGYVMVHVFHNNLHFLCVLYYLLNEFKVHLENLNFSITGLNMKDTNFGSLRRLISSCALPTNASLTSVSKKPACCCLATFVKRRIERGIKS